MKNVPYLSDRALTEGAASLEPGATGCASPAKLPVPIESGPRIEFGDQKGPHGPFETWMQERVNEKIGKDGTKVQLFAETLRSNISTMMLFCIPLFAFVLKILYLRKRRFHSEHLVYALHIHAFFYCAVIITAFGALAATRWAPGLVAPLVWICMLSIVVQVFLSIRQVYGQGWRMTTFKFFFGGFIYLFVLILAFIATALVTFALP